MKRGDFIWSAIMVCVVASLVNPTSRGAIMSETMVHPYLMGIIKFAILASMGELFAIRIIAGQWNIPCGMVYRVCFWGFMGFTLTTAVSVYANGVPGSIQSGILFGARFHSPVIRAFWTSVMMNATYGPVIMSAHRISDTYLDLAGGRLRNLPSVKFDTVLATINWHSLVVVVIFRLLTFFWIPAHTITFLLPPVYRVLCAAILGFVLGVLLAFFKRYKGANPTETPNTDALPAA
jgi:hypothetical protein